MDQATPNNLFRFMQLRPPQILNESMCLVDGTELVNEIAQRIKDGKVVEVPGICRNYLSKHSPSHADLGQYFQEIIEIFDSLDDLNDLFDALIDRFGDDLDVVLEIDTSRPRLSDIMVAGYYGSEFVSDASDIEIAFRIYEFFYLKTEGTDFEDVNKLFSTPLSLPQSIMDARKIYLESQDSTLIRPAGMAELMVVKQHIKRYDLTEIARVENIIAGESTSQTSRQFQQAEQYYFSETETTQEQELALDTTDRFELSKETSQTIQEDTRMNLGLTVSGSYGPYVEFTSSFELEKNQSQQLSENNATTYSRDIVERSVERYSQRVLEQRSLRIRKETEETKKRELANPSSIHRRGVFQFVDKVFEAQVFNYGYRQMYDFMLIEPAAYLLNQIQAKAKAAEPDLPDPPRDPKLNLADIKPEILTDEAKFRAFLDTYAKPVGAKLEPPPILTLEVSEAFEKSRGTEDKTPVFAEVKYKELPAGYKVVSARVVGSCTSDDAPAAGGVIGNTWWVGNLEPVVNSDNKLYIVESKFDIIWPGTKPAKAILTGPAQIPFGLNTYEIGNYAITVTILCELTEEAKLKWKIDTYFRIREAYAARLNEWQREVAAIKAEADALLLDGNVISEHPSFKRLMERAELKKQCLAILTNNQYFTKSEVLVEPAKTIEPEEDVKPAENNAPIKINVAEVLKQGSLIKFFEHAFEWEQIQYIFYPYYWARESEWEEKIFAKDNDALFLEFLSAGAARVVVPVRPGFEQAVQYYMDTGLLWNGRGNPPDITSPLYLSIVDEIKERTGAGKGELQVGQPWDIEVPTSVLWLRDDSQLPQWERKDANTWDWGSVQTEDSDFGLPKATKFVLVNADNNEDIMPLMNGMTINLADMPTNEFTIRVETIPEEVGSVKITLNEKTATENFWPYTIGTTLRNETEADYMQENHLLRAIAYTEKDLNGETGGSQTIRFTVNAEMP